MKIDRVCPICETQYKANEAQLKNGRQITCSVICSKISMIGKKTKEKIKIDKICPICNVLYSADTKRLKHGRQTTCSRKCSYELRALNPLLGYKSSGGRPSGTSSKIALICPSCDKVFNRYVAQQATQKSYCSRVCYGIGVTNGTTIRKKPKPYKVINATHESIQKRMEKNWETRRRNGTDGWPAASRAKQSERMCNQIKIGQIKRISKQEDLVAIELDKHNIIYERQYKIRNDKGTYCAIIDFVIDNNIAIEVNGTFYHSDPRFYPNGPTCETQRRNIQKYNKKLEIIKPMFSIIEIWEHEIKLDVKSAVTNALKGHSINGRIFHVNNTT